MGEYVQHFMDQSTKLTQYVRNQLGRMGLWTNVPGSLEKIGVSESGFVWGYNSAMTIFSCKDPCEGAWASYGNLAGALTSMAVDKTRVYFLMKNPNGSRAIAVRPVDGSGGWTMINVPSGDPSSTDGHPGFFNNNVDGNSDPNQPNDPREAGDSFRFNLDSEAPVAGRSSGEDASIEVTDSFIFVGAQSCAKPCATNNWVVNDKTKNAKASSSGHVYMMDTTADGREVVRRSDGSAQGGWDELEGLKGVTPLSAQGDNTAIYGMDKKGTPVRCQPPYSNKESCKFLDTAGRKPKSLSVNPANNSMYLTTAESGPSGNIFYRLDGDNSEEVLMHTEREMREMDRDVNSLGNEIRIQNAEINAAKNIRQASEVFHEATNINGPLENSVNDRQKLRTQIMGSSEETSLYKTSLMPLQVLAITLILLFIVFVTAGFVMPKYVTTGLGVVILASGLGTAIYFVVKKQ